MAKMIRRMKPAAKVAAASPAPAPAAAPQVPKEPAAAPAVTKSPTAARKRVIVPISPERLETLSKAQAIVHAADPDYDPNAQTNSARIVADAIARIRNPMTAIRARCIQCCNGQPKEVRLCPASSCALHPFRLGTNPYNKRVAERLAAEAGGDDEDGDEPTDE